MLTPSLCETPAGSEVLQTLRSIAQAPADRGLQRSRGALRIAVGPDGALADLYQSGAAKARFPRVYTHDGVEAVLINTAGGLTGGDTMRADLAVAGGRAVFTSQAAEKLYRASAGVADVATTMTVAAGAQAIWAPQETILFDRSGLRRSLAIDAAAGAGFTAIEPIVFGRAAMGERVARLSLRDRWRVRIDSALTFADDARIDGDAADALAARSGGDGARGFATGLHLSPDLERACADLRAIAVGPGLRAGVGLVRGLLTFRLVAADPAAMRAWIAAAYARLTGLPPPIAWRC